MEETKEIDIDLRKIFYMMRTKIVFIVLITVLMGVIAGCFTHFFIAPTYTATCKMVVYSNTDRASTDTSISINDINASQSLVNTYIYTITCDTVLDKVAADLKLNEGGSSLAKMISANVVEDTMACQVTVRNKDPKMAADIANSIAKIAPGEIARIIHAGGAEVIDYAKEPKSPSSPNTKKNIIVGALAGFMVSFAAFFIYEMFDTTITNAKDLERDFEIPVLGTIPRLETVEPSKNDTDGINQDMKLDLPTGVPRPSDSILENLQSMKEDGRHD